MEIRYVLSALSGLIFLVAFYPYIKAIVKREARPRKATWLIWAAGDWIILIGMLANGTTSGQMIAACMGATTIFLLSLRYGETGWETRDKVCITLSTVAIMLWLYFGESNLGIGFSLLSLAIAAWPTYVSAWDNPRNESAKAWILFEISSVVAVMAIPRMTFADAAPAIAFLIIDSPMMYLLFIRQALRQRRLRTASDSWY